MAELPVTDQLPVQRHGKTRVYASGAVGVHLSGLACRSTTSTALDRVWVSNIVPGDLDPVIETIVTAVHAVEPNPQFVVVGMPGQVHVEEGTVAGAANLGTAWRGTVHLGDRLRARLKCDVELRNDAEAAMQGERRRGGLLSCNDGALIIMSHGVGVCLLRNGVQQPTELGHSVSQFGGPECQGRVHAGCYESFLGGWALPLRYREQHPNFMGKFARDIPDDQAFWHEAGRRLGDLVVSLCLQGQPLEEVTFIGTVALARHALFLPGVIERVSEERELLITVPRNLKVTPLGEDGAVLGAFLMARDLLYPFLAA